MRVRSERGHVGNEIRDLTTRGQGRGALGSKPAGLRQLKKTRDKVFAETERFDYRVVEVHAVSRTDVSVLESTETPSVSLITCTGDWNAALHDYMQRLVVRAELE